MKVLRQSGMAHIRNESAAEIRHGHRPGIKKKAGKDMKKRKVVWYILLGANLLLLLMLGMQYGKRLKLQQGIAEKVLRFHVLANSDSGEDQALKLKVRDAVGAEMAQVLAGAESRGECEEIVASQLDHIVQTAEAVIAEEGYDYEVDAFLREVEFPVKTYGSYTFPAGDYEALEVVIGAGEGHNWWCVMYPNMCFSGSVYEVVDEEAEDALEEVLSADEYAEIMSSGNYEIQFKYLTFLNGLRE